MHVQVCTDSCHFHEPKNTSPHVLCQKRFLCWTICIPLQIVRRLNKRRSILHAEKCIFFKRYILTPRGFVAYVHPSLFIVGLPFPHLLPPNPIPTYSHVPLPPPTPTYFYLYPHSPPSHPEINTFVWEFLDIICTPSGLREAPLNRVLPKNTTKTMSVTLSLPRSL